MDIAMEGEKFKRVKMSLILIRHSLRLNRFESTDYHVDWMISPCQIITVKWRHRNRGKSRVLVISLKWNLYENVEENFLYKFQIYVLLEICL